MLLCACPVFFKIIFSTNGKAQATGVAGPSVAASMIADLREESSHEDELTSKAVPATMYLGKFLRLAFLFNSVDLSCIPSGGADTVSLRIFTHDLTSDLSDRLLPRSLRSSLPWSFIRTCRKEHRWRLMALWGRTGFPTLATKHRCLTSRRSSKKYCDGILSRQLVRINQHPSPW